MVRRWPRPSMIAAEPTRSRLLTPALVAIGLALYTTGCARPARETERPIVAVSVAPQAYVVEKLAGGLVRVNVTLPPGVEVHSYEPTFQVLTALSEASLYVKVGHPSFAFEKAWLDRLLHDRPDMRVVDSMRGVAVDAGDPHVWVAPTHVRAMAGTIATALSDLLPGNRAEIEQRLASFEKEIDDLDAEIRRTLASANGRRFFVFHPAWGYFAREYGLEQVAIERDGREPDPKTLAGLIADARAAGVRIIYVQPQHSGASARLIAAEIGARVESIDPLAYEWTENLRETARKIADGLVK